MGYLAIMDIQESQDQRETRDHKGTQGQLDSQVQEGSKGIWESEDNRGTKEKRGKLDWRVKRGTWDQKGRGAFLDQWASKGQKDHKDPKELKAHLEKLEH